VPGGLVAGGAVLPAHAAVIRTHGPRAQRRGPTKSAQSHGITLKRHSTASPWAVAKRLHGATHATAAATIVGGGPLNTAC
jgi:hypothetical protein